MWPMSLSLNCLVVGDDLDRTFTVEIPRNKSISILKDLIKWKKAPHLDHVAASDLDLWQVSFPINDLETELGNINLASCPKLLPPTKKLTTFFTDVAEDCLHILAKVPEVNKKLEDLQRLREYLWGEDKVKIASVAGKSYSTIDLTLFKLNLNVRPDNILLVREEYILAYNDILADTLCQPRGWRRSATLVTGQSGIGKTLFLLYVLARRLQEKEPVALQLNSVEFALFDDRGVSLHSSVTGQVPKGAWALSDSSSTHFGLCDAFQYPSAHIVHTSSPDSHNWKNWVKRLSARRYIMDVWSLEELRTFLTIQDLNVQHGEALFRKFGPSVRIIINIVLNPSPTMEAQYLHDVRVGAANIATRFSTVFSAFKELDFSSDISSNIFTIRPNHSDSRWQPALYISTPFLASTLGVAMSRQEVAQQHAFFSILSGHPSLRSAAGWLFENYAHVHFSDPYRNPIQAYLRDQSPHCIPAPSHIITGSTPLKTIQPPHNFYWRPREPNFEGVDAVIRAGNIVWALQFTISASHRPATGGLTEVLNKMNHKKDVDWNLVMVGSGQRNAELARNGQKLDGQWAQTPVYACALPLVQFTYNDQRLQNILNEAIDTYPVDDQAADLDDSMSEPL